MRLLFALFILLLAGTPAMAETVTIKSVNGLDIKTSTNEALTLYGITTRDKLLTTRILQPLLEGQQVNIHRTGHDRWGQVVSQITTMDGKNAMLELLKAGGAQLMPEAVTPTKAMRDAEQEGRMPPKGLWRNECCRVLSPEQAQKTQTAWRIVSGKVLNVSPGRDLTFVNFGEDWKTDFTIIVPASLMASLKPQTWVGKHVEVRGWIESYYGPSIKIQNTAQIRLPE